MVLVGYSDSDSSDTENMPTTKIARATAPSAKPAFQKVVDRSDPQKVKVSLPVAPIVGVTLDGSDEATPPAKRARVGGAFSSMNSLLPTPKRIAAGTGGFTSGRRGLGTGINLKTGAAPAFSREPEPEREDNKINEDSVQQDDTVAENPLLTTLKLPEPNSNQDVKIADVKLVGKPSRFVPLSVSRKKQKPKRTTSTDVTSTTTGASSTSSSTRESKPPARPKVSLFSVNNSENDPDYSTTQIAAGSYRPMFSEEHVDAGAATATIDSSKNEPVMQSLSSGHTTTPIANPESLHSIAESLNLSASARRQLLGRRSAKDSPLAAISVRNMNVDEEYAANEELRAAGQAVEHRAVRSVAPGKHSLQQLVNAAATNQDALEDSWARGRTNKAEAGKGYGWSR
ncbi:hypothetical protein LTR66_005911 [Elasticomyces elasticus]|nr:hypothetical protein LTR66_005911 [Elasticomyces elasticus]